MKKALGLVAAAAMLLPATAFAQEADQAAKAEKKICKSEKITGSLTRVRRICMTQRDWDALSSNHNQVIDDLGRSAAAAEALKGNREEAKSAMSGTF